MTKFLRKIAFAFAVLCGATGGASAEVSPVCLTPAARLTETPEEWIRQEYIREEVFTPRPRCLAPDALTVTLAGGGVIKSVFDEYGALAGVNEIAATGQVAGADITLARNLLGAPTAVTDGAGGRSFTYYERGELKTETFTSGPFSGASLAYAIETGDALPLRRPTGFSFTAPGDAAPLVKTLAYKSATDSRVATVSGLGVTANYAMRADGRPDSVTVAGTSGAALLTRTFGYDGAGRLTSVETRAGNSGAPVVLDRSITFGTGTDSLRRKTARREDGATWTYDYTLGGALRHATMRAAGGAILPGHDFTYVPDALANRAGGVERGGADLVATETPNLLNAPSVIAEPGLLQVTGTMDTAAALTAYSWEGASPVTLIGPWSGSGPAATATGNSGASAEYAATLTPGAWRPSLKWPTVTTPATAVRVTLDLPGHPLETVVVNPGQQPGTALSLSGNRATTGGTARIRIGANVPATGTVGLPTLVWERKVTAAQPTSLSVTVEPTNPVAAVTSPTSAITLAGGSYRVLLPAPAGASGAYTQRVMLRATVTDPVTGKTDFAECAGGFTGVAGTVNLVHDADGRRTADVRHTNITWTPGGRVTSITLPSGIRVEDTHDAEGRRVRRIRHAASGETTSRTDTFWDGWSPIEEKEYDGVGVLLRTRRYLWGLDLDGSQGGMGHVGGLVAINDNGTLYLPAYDTAGHVIGLLDTSGNVVANYEYGPFGEPLRETGPAALVCPFRWNTRYWDADTGFYYFGHRHYDAITGKWLSREPLGEGAGLNLFAYCHGDPVNHFDYLGLAEFEYASVIDGQPKITWSRWSNAFLGNLGGWGGRELYNEAPDAANLNYYFRQSGGAWSLIPPGERGDYRKYQLSLIPEAIDRAWRGHAVTGALDATMAMAEGGAHAVAHPIDTAVGLKTLGGRIVDDPIGTAKGLWNVSTAADLQYASWSYRFGYGAVNIGSTLEGGYGMGKGALSLARTGGGVVKNMLRAGRSADAAVAIGDGLASSVRSSFTSGKYTPWIAEVDTILYRAENFNQGSGRFFGLVRPVNSLDAEIMYNINKWGNNATQLREYMIPAGTRGFIGGVEGGTGIQVFLPNAMGLELVDSSVLFTSELKFIAH